jgi:outer membrane biosynthesis protein TonB
MAARRITSHYGGLLSPVTTLRVLPAAILAAALTCLSPVSATAVAGDTTTSSTDAGTEQSQDTGSTPTEGSPPSEPADEPSEETSEEASQPAEEPSEEESKPAEEPSEEESKTAEDPSEEEPEADPERTGTVNGEDETEAGAAEAEARPAADVDPAAEPIAVDDTDIVRAGRTVRVRVTENDTDAAGATVTLPAQPADGTATVVGDAVDFTPADGFEGTTRFDYALAVGGAVRSTATVTVTVVPPPSGTRAIDDQASTPVNTGGHDGVLIFVMSNDVEAGQATPALESGPAHGTATVLTNCGDEFCGDPLIRYTPDEGFTGTDTFRYALQVDGEPADTATVTVDVSGDSESGARAVDDTVTVQAGGSVAFFPTANDEPGTWIPEVQQQPAHGQVAAGEGLTLRYTPDKDFVSGVDTFTYRLTPPPVVVDIRLDDRPLDQIRLLAVAPVPADDIATVTVIVNGPVSVEDSATTTAGAGVDIDVEANDSGTGGFCLVVPPGQAMAGTARLAGEGEVVRYTPASGFVGTDEFTYAYQPGCEGDATVAPATVTVTVTAPEAADDGGRTFTGPVGGLPVLLDVLDNDDPVAGLFRLAVGRPQLGTAEVVPRGEASPVIRYTPAPGTAGGIDTFEYQLVSSTGQVVASAAVSVVVTPVTAAADAEFTTAGAAVEIDAGANDTLPEGVTAVVTRQPGAGSAEVVDPGGAVFRYTPGDGFTGSDSFEYALVAAGAGETPFRLATETVTITRAQAVADAATSRFRRPVEVDVRANDTGAQNLQVRVATPPEDDTVEVEELGEGVFRVTPLDGFAGTAEFTYELVHDGRAVDAADVTVEVPEATVARDDEAETDAGVPVPVDVLANDETTAGLRVEIVRQPARGTVTVAADGAVTYTPNAGLTGLDTFGYALVADGLEDPVATADVRVTVRTPVAVDDAATMFGGRSEDVDVLANDRFAAGFTVRPLAPSDGTATLLTSGAVRYTPDAGFAGADRFRYELLDADGAVVARATVRVTVRLVDARDDAATTERGQRARIRVLANDDVVSGVTVRLIDRPANGTVTLRADGRVDYVPSAGFTGTDRFRYALTGVVGGARIDLDVARVTVTVEPPETPPDGNPGGNPGGNTPGDGTPGDTNPDPGEQPVPPRPGTDPAPQPQPESGVELDVDTTSPGADVEVTGRHCPPTGEVVVEVDGREVATGTARSDGTYVTTIPAPTGVGRHDIGVTCGSGTTTTRLDVVVTTMQSGTQAPAGAAAAAAALLLFFLLSGLGMNPTGRTRQRPR